jgi:alkanesulfonate monooxygenase
VHVFDPEDDIEAASPPGVAYGLRIPVLARDDDGEAWEAARRLSSGTAPGASFRNGLVGSFETVAAGIRDYIDRGVGVFFLEATPYIEETYRLGERLLPLLTKEGARVR